MIDETPLAGTLYPSARTMDPPRGVLICSAMGVRRRYYDRFAHYLADQGFDVLTFDYRGIGDSRRTHARRSRATMREWGERDIDHAIGWFGAEFPGARLTVVAHSAGGQLVGLADRSVIVSSMVFIGVQSGYWRLWSGPMRYLLASLWFVFMPGLSRLFWYFPAHRLGLGEDLPHGVALEWSRWCRHPNYMIDAHGESLTDRLGRYRGSILAYSFADDRFAPRPSVERILSCYSGANVTHRHLAPTQAVGHFGFFRDQHRYTLWPEVADWIAAQSPQAR